jgi:general secretion pathway protein A
VAVAPSTGASAANEPPAPALAPLETLLPELPRDITLAWHALPPTGSLPATGDPCAASATQQLQCYRTTKLNLPLLRQLARPGILTLHDADDSGARYAVLVGMADQTATLLVNNQRHTLSLNALTRYWRGDFATLWRVPDGYNPAARGGASGPAITQLARQLDQLEGISTPAPPTTPPQQLDAALKQRVRDFQRTHGLQADGQPGPMTYMQLESALGSHTPWLTGGAVKK